MTDLNVNLIRAAGGGPLTITMRSTGTVAELKVKIQGATGMEPVEQRLIYAGRILKDTDTLAQHSYISGNAIHLVKAATNRAQQQAAEASGSPQAAERVAGQPNPFGGGGGGMPGLPPGMNMDQMDQMMQNPMMQGLMNNPEFMREMMMNNPQIRALTENNPELRNALTDPETIRQSLQMARDPAMRAQMMRNQDRALSNIEAMPGGFNMLRQLHNDIQEPLMEATQRQAPLPNAPPARTNPSVGREDNPFIALLQPPVGSGAPNTAPMPNPWAAPAPAAANPAAAPTPFGSMFGGPPAGGPPAGAGGPATGAGGGMGGMGDMAGMMNNPAMQQMMQNMMGGGGGGGGMPGMPGMPGGAGAGGMPNLPPEAMEQMMTMLENPQMQTMMDSMMGNPGFLEQQLANNPMLAGNPQLQAQARAMMGNPEARRAMMNPQVMRAAMQMQQAQATLAGAGLGGVPPPAGIGGTTPAPAPGANPFASLFGAPPPAAAPTAADYADQLRQMKDMGFYDEAANLRALAAVGGNVSAAVERLLTQI